MSTVAASCPGCSVESEVPKEMVGKKVRCKSCKATFVVVASAPKTTRPASKTVLAVSGAMRRPAKKSNATLWVVLSVVSLLLVGGAGVGMWYAMQEEPVKHAKPKTRKGDAAKPFVDDTADKKQAKAGKNAPILDVSEPRPNKSAPPTNSKTPPAGEVKMTEPVVVAALSASTPLEIKDLSVIKAILPLGNVPHQVGLHTKEGNQHYFELYDLQKKTRLTKVKLAEQIELVAVDPDGAMLATSNHEKRFNMYALPEGAIVEDEWAPYDNIKDQLRFLGDGKITYIAFPAKNQFWVMTGPGYGDLWELPSKKAAYFIPAHAREDFLKATAQPNRDFVLSPDHSRFAYATDEGIQLHDAKTGQRTGATPKLTKYGTKPELIGMGFDPGGTKLAVYFTAGKAEGRPIQHARFSVPTGEELMMAPAPDAGDTGSVDFVSGDYLFAVESLERNHAELRDGKGKIVAVCNIPGRSSAFSPKVVQANVAFAYMNDKNQPSLGLVRIPVGGPVVAAAPPPPPVVTKGKSLSELFTGKDSPPTPTPAPTKERTFDRQEIWEFGSQGIMRKGIKSFEQK